MAQALGSPPPMTAAQVAKKKSVNVTKVTKAEEAIFTLQPGKDALARLAASLRPFEPVLSFVRAGLAWESTRKAMALQFLFCLAVLHPEYLVPTILCTVGACTLAANDRGEESRTRGSKGSSSEGSKSRSSVDARSAQRLLESLATTLERVTAVTTWEDPIVTTAFVASCVALAFLCAYVRFQTVVLGLGVWAMRPPAWKVVPGPAANLLERMPDKAEEYGRLMQGGGGGAAIRA